MSYNDDHGVTVDERDTLFLKIISSTGNVSMPNISINFQHIKYNITQSNVCVRYYFYRHI